MVQLDLPVMMMLLLTLKINHCKSLKEYECLAHKLGVLDLEKLGNSC